MPFEDGGKQRPVTSAHIYDDADSAPIVCISYGNVLIRPKFCKHAVEGVAIFRVGTEIVPERFSVDMLKW